VPAMILRSSNNYGTHQNPEKLHSLVITNLLEKKTIPIHGKGNHLRSWIHVWDFCSALDLVMHKGKLYEIYNVSGEEKSTLEVIKIIGKTLGIEPREFTRHVNDRPGPDFRYSPDRNKIMKELKWKPRYTYKKAIIEIVD